MSDKLWRYWASYYDTKTSHLYIRNQHNKTYSQYRDFHSGIPFPKWKPASHHLPVYAKALSETESQWFICSSHSQPEPLAPKPPALSFSDYIQNLLAWPKDLLQHMELRESPYFLLQHLRECLTKTNARDSWQLLFISDGSATKQTMSFGWKLVSSDETTLAVNRGPAWGPPGSFRAEAYGMLSAVLCVQHIMLYCNATDSFTMKLVTDNKGLLICCQQRMQYPDSFPTATLASDWDVVEQIVSLLRQTSINPFFGHVLGHQDEHTTSVLPKNATNLLDLHTKDRRESNGYTSPACTLQIEDGTTFDRIFLLHMRKAGGSSMRSYFRDVTKKYNISWGFQEGPNNVEFPGDQPNTNTLYVTHMRKPISRALSHYKYEKRWQCGAQLQQDGFVPMENNTNMPLKEFASSGFGKRQANFLWTCSQECHSSRTWHNNILKDKERLEQLAREKFGGYHLIVINEWLKIPEYDASLEKLFGVNKINRRAGMQCMKLTLKATKENPLNVTQEELELLNKGNTVDFKLYKEYTTCPNGAQFWNRHIKFEQHH
jgi:hypothetical protein